MTWPIFAVLQSALMLIGALIVFTLHHRRLSKENAALRDACEASAAEPADAGGEGWEAWLREQIGALGDGDEERIQKLVFENALAPADDFGQRLSNLEAIVHACASAQRSDLASKIHMSRQICVDMLRVAFRVVA